LIPDGISVPFQFLSLVVNQLAVIVSEPLRSCQRITQKKKPPNGGLVSNYLANFLVGIFQKFTAKFVNQIEGRFVLVITVSTVHIRRSSNMRLYHISGLESQVTQVRIERIAFKADAITDILERLANGFTVHDHSSQQKFNKVRTF
jgi:hypothetical protein